MHVMKFLSKALRIHPAWLVLFACCCFFGASMGIYSNCAALYTADLLAEMGWSMTLLTALDIAGTLARVGATYLTYKIFRRYNLKLVLTLGAVIMFSSCILKGFVHNIPTYIIMSLLFGAGGAFLLYVPVPMLLNNWFAKKKDTALGISMLCSGLCASVCSPIFSNLILSRGWRSATVINGIVSLIVAIPPILLFAVKTPEEMGLKPYGWEEPKPMKVATSPSEVFENGHEDFDTRFTPQQKTRRFLLSAVFALLVGSVSAIPAKFPHFGTTTAGIGTSTGALMFSASQIGNMASKALMGPLCDKFGPRKTYTTSLAIVLAACAALVFIPKATYILLPVAFLTGLSCGNNMMIYPAAVRTYSRGEEYTYYISKVSMALTLFGTPFSLLLGVMYDSTQSYFSTFLLFTVMDAVCVVLSLMMFRKQDEKAAGGKA